MLAQEEFFEKITFEQTLDGSKVAHQVTIWE
jgi:hypothetical protein